jgi:membrane fusion protein (multidrug efflux system)
VLDQAIAQRDTNKADIASAQAAIRTAEINLGFTTIKAPIAGRIGRALVTKGNLVDSSTSPLASVVQVDPIRVVFSVPDRAFMAFRQKLAAQPGSHERRFVPSLRLPDGSDYDQKGEIAFIDNRVDPNTGTIAIWARFPNPDAVLLPGAFVTIAIRPEQAERRPLVPVAAVQEDRDGKFVLMLDGENTVREQRVEATRQIDQNWIVEGGLSGGERIIIDGLQKARPGAKVNPVPARQRPDAKT